MQARLEALRQELETGQAELQRVEAQRAYLHETMLRMSGAVQVLTDLLEEEQSDGAAPVEERTARAEGLGAQ